MAIFSTLLTVILVFICLLIVLLVLMQRPKQEGLGAAFGGGMTDQMFGAQTTNVLQRGTVYFAVGFFLLSATLAAITARENKVDGSLGENLKNAPAIEADEPPAAPAPVPLPSDSDTIPVPAPAETTSPEPATPETPTPEPADTSDEPEPSATGAETEPTAPEPAPVSPDADPGASDTTDESSENN